MARVRWIFMATVVVVGATAAVMAATPDDRIPSVVAGSTDVDEMHRTLTEVRSIVESAPTVTVDSLRDEYPLLRGLESPEADPSWLALAIGIGVLGLLVRVRAGNRFGGYLVAFALAMASFGLARTAADLHLRRDLLPPPLDAAVLALADLLWVPIGVVVGTLLVYVFPDGRFVGPGWRRSAWLASIAAGIQLIHLAQPVRFDGRALSGGGLLDPDTVDAVLAVGIWCWMAAVLAAAASFFVRVVRSTGEQRVMLSWVGYGLAVAVVAGAVSLVAQGLGGDPAFWGPLQAIGFFVVLPGTVLVAIFRFRLYDIDLVVHRTLRIGAMTLGVALVYVTIVAGVGALFEGIGWPATVVAIAAAAVAIEPARARLHDAADRLVYRDRNHPYDVLSDAASRLAGEVDLDAGLDRLAAAVAAGTGAALVEVWVEVWVEPVVETAAETVVETADGAPPRLVAAWSAGDAAVVGPRRERFSLVEPIEHGGFIGVVLRRGDRLRPHERRLLADLAAGAGRLLEHLRLRDAQSVRVAEAERRRDALEEAERRLADVSTSALTALERDLHDGAQARVVRLGALVGMARTRTFPDPSARDRLLHEIDEAERETGRFAAGLFPAELRSGPIAALRRTFGDGPIDVTFLDGGVRVDHDREAALYFMGAEAVQNATKHAAGAPVTVELRCEGRGIALRVRDRGAGIADGNGAGCGMTNMADRIEALGGDFSVDSSAAGTVVVGRFDEVGA